MMEHNDNEQRANPDASASFVPGVLTRLGLSQTAPSPTTSEEQVVNALNSPAWPVRLAAVQQLEMLAERVPLAALLRALRDEHETVRAAAARALGMLASRASVEPLVGALRDSEWTVRAAAALALGKLKGRTPVEPLVAALHDEDASVRATAAWALGTLGEQAPLANALHDSAWIVREAAVLALGELGARVPAALLLAARSDRDEPVRQVAELVLQHIYPELLASTSINTIASVSEHEASTSQHVKSNGHHNHDLKSIWPARPKQQKRLQRQPVPARTRLFPRVAAGVLAALVIIAAMFSWFAVLHRPQVLLSGHPTAIPTSNIETYRVAGGSVYGVAWSPDGTEIASTNAVGLVQIWDTVTGHTISTYRGNFLKVLSLVWSPSNSLLVTAEGADRTVQVWNAATGHKDWPSFVHTDAVSVVAWSPDGKRCAVATVRGLVEIWDNPSWQKVQIAPADEGWSDLDHPLVVSIAWSPDDTRLAFTTAGGLVQVWDAGTTRLLYTYPGHTEQVNDVAWSPDGTHIASASDAGTVQFWPCPSSIEVGKLRVH